MFIQSLYGEVSSLFDNTDADFLGKLEHELQYLDYKRVRPPLIAGVFLNTYLTQKNNDLYDFFQSDDLRTYGADRRPLVAKFREILYGDKFRDFMKRVYVVQLLLIARGLAVQKCTLGHLTHT